MLTNSCAFVIAVWVKSSLMMLLIDLTPSMMFKYLERNYLHFFESLSEDVDVSVLLSVDIHTFV